MRQTILIALAAATIGGIGGSVLVAEAQPAPPPPAMTGQVQPPQPWMRWMHHAREMREHSMRRTFGLVYRQEDRQLTPPDVQKIAEAFLLWNGNHSWKVVDVAATPDGAIGFGLATQEGSIIARFTMDPHTGRLTRTA